MTLIDFMLTFWLLITAYIVLLAICILLPVGLSRFDRKRQVKQMHRMRRAEKPRTITVMGQQFSYYPPPPPPPPTRFVNDSKRPRRAT